MYNPGTEMTTEQAAVFDFERSARWKYLGAKETAIRETFGISLTRYNQVLNRAIDTEEALRIDPVNTRRLRRLREYRQAQRSSRRLGFSL